MLKDIIIQQELYTPPLLHDHVKVGGCRSNFKLAYQLPSSNKQLHSQD